MHQQRHAPMATMHLQLWVGGWVGVQPPQPGRWGNSSHQASALKPRHRCTRRDSSVMQCYTLGAATLSVCTGIVLETVRGPNNP